MARELRNISGGKLAVQDTAGRWIAVPPDGIVSVGDDDQRYWQTGDQGEQPLFAEVKSSKSTTREGK